jgi:DNA-binding transcriptional LysR family regulator
MNFDPRDFADLIAIRQFGTLSAAAKRRGAAISTVSRRIEALEAALKLRLVDRRTDGVRLTQHGEEIATLAEPLAEQLGRVARAADALRTGGTILPIRISATEAVIADVLAPALGALWRAGATRPVHLQVQADVVSLAARNADIAVRMSKPEGASLIARRLPELKLGLFASKAYLNGRDTSVLRLSEESFLVYDDSYGRLPELDWFSRNGLSDAIIMRTASTRALLTATLGGGGIGLLPVVFANQEAELVEIPTGRPIPARQPWLIVHRDLQREPAIRIVHRWIVETFKTLVQQQQAQSGLKALHAHANPPS